MEHAVKGTWKCGVLFSGISPLVNKTLIMQGKHFLKEWNTHNCIGGGEKWNSFVEWIFFPPFVLIWTEVKCNYVEDSMKMTSSWSGPCRIKGIFDASLTWKSCSHIKPELILQFTFFILRQSSLIEDKWKLHITNWCQKYIFLENSDFFFKRVLPLYKNFVESGLSLSPPGSRWQWLCIYF